MLHSLNQLKGTQMSLTYIRTITPLISEKTFPVFFPHFFEAITCFLPFAAWELVAFIVNFGKFFPSNIWILDAFNQLAQFCRLVLGKFDFCPLVQLFNMLFQAVSLQPGIGVACTFTFWGKEFHRIVAWGLLSFVSFWWTQFAARLCLHNEFQSDIHHTFCDACSSIHPFWISRF